jgi:phage tail tape-measure protein
MTTKKEETGLERARNTEHVLVDVGTVCGAVTGAVAGLVGGPPGVIAGTAIGAALGAAAGEVLDRESHRQDMKERALDTEIGVIYGDLGAREIVRASFAGKEERAEAHRRELEAELDPVRESETG